MFWKEVNSVMKDKEQICRFVRERDGRKEVRGG